MEEELDRISNLPENAIIDHIFPCLPIIDAGRTSILSKRWKELCKIYNISLHLILDLNSFALTEILRSSNCEPAIHDIRDRFMDFAQNLLSTMNEEKAAALQLEIDIAVIAPDFSHVDQLMDLVRNTKAEKIKIFVQTQDFRWGNEIQETDVYYTFPYFIFTNAWLQSLALRGCKLMSQPLSTDALCSTSLRELLLSEVLLSDKDALYNLACNVRIEVISFNCCTFRFNTLELSILTHLKKASFSGPQYGLVSIDLTETKLESFHCSSVRIECKINLASCSNLKEIDLSECKLSEPHLLKDLTTSFPLLEEASVFYRNTKLGVDSIKACNQNLMTLKLFVAQKMEQIYVNCPKLNKFRYTGACKELCVNCPNLKVFQYNTNDKFPVLTLCQVSICDSVWLGFRWESCETSCFISLRKFLEQIANNEVVLNISVDLEKVAFVPDEFGANWTSQQKNVQSKVRFHLLTEECSSIQKIGSLVDGLIWSTLPSTLIVYGFNCCGFIKDLCGKLELKGEKRSCCEVSGSCNVYWWHNLQDFTVKMNNQDMTRNLQTLVETYETRGTQGTWLPSLSSFSLHWLSPTEEVDGNATLENV